MLSMMLTVLYLLDYVIPFSRSTKGVENATSAYYGAYGKIEDALYEKNQEGLGDEPDSDNNLDLASADAVVSKRHIRASGTVIPLEWEGNSEYDTDWNRIGPNNPLQLEFPDGVNIADLEFNFRVPNLNNDETNDEALKIFSNPEEEKNNILKWQIITESNVLSSVDHITVANINGSNITLWWAGVEKEGQDLFGNSINFWEDASTSSSDKYKNFSCDASCTLKISPINDLITTDDIKIPYLEYKITVPSGDLAIPLQYTILESAAKSYGYRKQLKLKVQQDTTIDAFDFTVFQ